MDPVTITVVALVVLAGGGAVAVGVTASRRTARRQQAEREKASAEIATLAHDAGQALVRADEQVRLARDEVGFAAAEFGEAAAAEYRTVLERARGDLAEAFRLNQLLYDENPDTPDERRQMSNGILEVCTSIQTALRAQNERVAGLRASKRETPEAISRTRADIAVARGRLEPARMTLARLADRYAESALFPVAGNVDQAERLLDFSEHSLGIAEQRHSAGQITEADRALRVATESVARASGLLDAADGFETEALGAEATLSAVIEDSRGDIAAARALPVSSTELSDAIARLQQATDAASRPTERRDPFATLSTLREANTALDALVARVQQSQADAERLRVQLVNAIDDAERQIAAARQLVDDYRAPVGPDARTRLAEAQRLLDGITGENDPAAARERARRSATLAAESMRLAHDDIARASAYPAGYGRGRGFGGDALTGILGGMVIGGLLDDIGDFGDFGDFG